MEADVEHENWDASTISSGRPSPVKSCNVIACSVALNFPPSKLAHSLLAFWTISVAIALYSPHIAAKEKHRRTMLVDRVTFISNFYCYYMSRNDKLSGAL
jgi:hypothetical protein